MSPASVINATDNVTPIVSTLRLGWLMDDEFIPSNGRISFPHGGESVPPQRGTSFPHVLMKENRSLTPMGEALVPS